MPSVPSPRQREQPAQQWYRRERHQQRPATATSSARPPTRSTLMIATVPRDNGGPTQTLALLSGIVSFKDRAAIIGTGYPRERCRHLHDRHPRPGQPSHLRCLWRRRLLRYQHLGSPHAGRQSSRWPTPNHRFTAVYRSAPRRTAYCAIDYISHGPVRVGSDIAEAQYVAADAKRTGDHPIARLA